MYKIKIENTTPLPPLQTPDKTTNNNKMANGEPHIKPKICIKCLINNIGNFITKHKKRSIYSPYIITY